MGTVIDRMNDFHLFSRKDSVKAQIHIDNYLEWGMLGWVFVCDLVEQRGITGWTNFAWSLYGRDERIDGAWAERTG